MDHQSQNNNNFFEKIRKVVLFVSVLVFIFSAYILIKQLVIDPISFDRNLQKIKQIKEDSEKFSSKFKDLIDLNPDIKGWIKIDGTEVDYPVLQSSMDDPIFYLYKNYEKQDDKNGSIFINAYYDLFDEDTQNTVMHGHNMGSGKMFATILKYSDVNFLKDHHIVNFDSIYGNGKWKVFAIIKTNSKEEHGPIFDYYRPKFDSQESFFELIYDIKIRSLINVPVDFSKNDKIISLSTCSPKSELEGFRTVLFARKIRENETEEIDKDKISVNKNPLMPNGWYNAKKLSIPKFPSFKEQLENGKIDWINFL